MQSRPEPLDYALLVLLALIWGSSFTLIKVVVRDIPPLTMTAGRIAIAAVALALAARIMGQAWPRGAPTLGWIVLAGLSGNVVPFALISWGEARIDSGLAAILISLMPLVTLVLAHYFTPDEPLRWNKLAGVGLGFMGLVVLMGPAALSHLGEDLARQGAVLAAAVLYAVNTIIVKRLSGERPVAMAAAIMAVSTLLLAPVAMIADAPWRLLAPASAWAWMAVLGIVQTALATLIMFAIVRHNGAGFFSQINFMIPLFGYLLGIALLGEPLRANALIALALILLGIFIATRFGARRKPGAGSEPGAGREGGREMGRRSP